MPDNTPQSIGPYEIVSPPRVGGMGAVYRAWDPRLMREVAIKVLAHDVADDLPRRRRLLEEAKAAGGLSHPNVMAVYDVGVHDGRPYIVSEYIHGRELREETDRGRVPIRRLLELAVQIAAGLRAAHDAGIVHRDLKPANVMVTRDGRVKIIDFGLATAADGAARAADHETVSVMQAVAGTPQYMSPEQARGQDVDFHTDQFSLGLILYELATGTHPFRRPSTAETMAAIITDEARPIGELAPKVPVVLRWIIERCLAKEPVDRYASTADLLKDLTTLQGRLGEVTAEAAPAVRRRRAGWSWAALALGLAAVAVLIMLPRRSAPHVEFTPLITDAAFQGAPAWSRDGQTLAYVSAVDGVMQIFTRRANGGTPHQVTQSRFDATDPFWSADNQRIYYQSLAHESQSLWSISSAGGPARLVIENASRAALSSDGRTLVFLREGNSPEQSVFFFGLALAMATAEGENVRAFTEPPFKDRTFVDAALRFSPDGTKLMAWVWGWSDDKSSTPRAQFWLVPWPTGRPTRVLPSLERVVTGGASFDWLADSRTIALALSEPGGTGSHLVLADTSTGNTTPLTTTVGSENRPAISPDGTRMSFTAEAIDFDLIEIPLDGSSARPLLSTSRNELDPALAHDGREIAYVSDKDGKLQIWLRSRDARFDQPIVTPEQFSGTTLALGAPSLAPDGQRIAFQRYAEEGGYQIFVSTVAGAGAPVLLTGPSRYQDAPTWSPDSQWIAYIERGVGDKVSLARVRVGAGAPPEVVLAALPRLGSRTKWSPDGRRIACDTTDGLTVVSTDGRQRQLVSEDSWIAFTWSNDGRQIFGLRESDDKPRHYMLAALDLASSRERIINPDVGVIPPAWQPIRGLEAAGDGTLITSVARARSDIWLLRGFESMAAGLRGSWPR
jgi:Tol biopolymer transport system component/tRNA A-37 threonylcarbamoyl transferase component Bud32